MNWIAGVALTFVAWMATQAIYVVLQAIVGSCVGATVKTMSVGFGPTIVEKYICGCVFRLSSLPFGGYTKFCGRDDVTDKDEINGASHNIVPFEDVSIFGRAAVLFVGPLSTIIIGLASVAIPVWIGADQVVVDAELPSLWTHTGVPNLSVARHSSTWNGQRELFGNSTFELFLRTITFRSLHGWSGPLGWMSTLGSSINHSFAVWLSCFGVTMIGFGLMNLLPIPVQNGGHLVFLLIEAANGRPPDRLLITASYLGMLFSLVMMGRLILADILWFWDLNV